MKQFCGGNYDTERASGTADPIQIPALWFSLRDHETPVLAKILAAVTVAYALAPIDLIPDFIPVIGYLDDLVILPLLAALTIRLIPKEVWQKNLELSTGMWDSGKPKKWYYALPILIIWLFILFLIIKAIWF